MLTLPGPLRHVRVRPSWGALLGLALVAVAVAAVTGVRILASGATAVPTAVSSSTATHGGASAGATAATSGARVSGSGASGKTSGGDLVVHVVGEVTKPGVVRLGEGARVEDALRLAGGATGKAELAAVNLARPLVDGEQIVVPAKGTVPAGVGAAGPNPGGRGNSSAAAGKVDLNSADAAALDALSGVGPVTASRIIEWRTAHGRFNTVDELAEVSGIGPKLVEQLRPLVRV